VILYMDIESFNNYANRLGTVLRDTDWKIIAELTESLLLCWENGQQVFICGNGGSAANAIHLANDFIYGVAKEKGKGLKAIALSANSAILTCLANDLGYDAVFSEQLAVQAYKGDVLIVLSGSGNSPNVIAAIKQAKVMGVKSFAILGFTGGECKRLVDVPIHFPVEDMQIAEDIQLVVGHMLMQYLYVNRSF